ncbi:MAG TPA: LTA synthase family protein [Stellaceae bacterium]|nr:LTA synthase family protein [Stellaceae bacterium]
MLHLAAGAALLVAAWLVPRHIAQARFVSLPAVLLDASPVALGAALLGVAAGRPLFAGVIMLAAGAGFALADYTMRQTLHEPVVFSEMSELPQVFTHPQLYLPFAGPGLVIGGAIGAALLAIALLLVEPPLWTPHFVAGLFATALVAVTGWLVARQPLLGATAHGLRRLRPSGEPYADAAALGPFAMLIAQTVIARDERRARQVALAAPAFIARRGNDGVPVIIVQCESFFDARRLSPQIPRDFLPGFEACCASAVQYGHVEVPGWGANTMRAEFAVVSGIAESELGYDRFNPYYALARVPLDSQVWRMRRGGYRTLCLHPFDARFFRRDVVMPALGFERFLDRRVLGGSSTPPYAPDPDLASHILHTLDAEGPCSLIFAITMGNHGPWLPQGPALDPTVTALFDPAGMPGGAELLRYLDGLRRSDAMLRLLMAGLEERKSPAILAFYGDHLPSLPNAFAHFGFTEPHSDYVIWRANQEAGMTRRHDLQAHQLGRAVVDLVLDPAANAPRP